MHDLAGRISTHFPNVSKELLVALHHLCRLASVEKAPNGIANGWTDKPSKTGAGRCRAQIQEQGINLVVSVPYNVRLQESG